MQKFFGKIEEIESPFNGKIQVLGSIEGPRIFVDGVLQSGRLMRSVWSTGISRIKRELKNADNVLILGLGAGSAAEVLNKHYPTAAITGLDIDPEMVNVGKKYLRLNSITNLKIVIDDAEDWVIKNAKKKSSKKFDLILIDLFHGERIPEKFYEEEFLNNVKKNLKKNGIVAFNHLYAFSDRPDASRLGSVLRKVFTKIITVTPEANIIYLAQKESH
jgi:spermidine synthase